MLFITVAGAQCLSNEDYRRPESENCTTLFSSLITNHTDTYYYRLENWPFKATAECDLLQIRVRAPTPCPHSPPKLTWNLQQDPHNNIKVNTDQTFTTKIQKTITLSDTHDGLTISCSATYPNTSVSISPSGLGSAGSWVNLTCSSRAKPPVSFSWFKNSKIGAIRVAKGKFYSVNVTSETEDYHCLVTNGLGNQRSSWIRLKSAENSVNALLWGPALGGVLFIILIICLSVCVWQSQEVEGPEMPGSRDVRASPIHYYTKEHGSTEWILSANPIIENRPFLSTASCDPLQITVKG
ncbi:hypothetical protein FQN60_007136, partial [Etheostoma spectabile]